MAKDKKKKKDKASDKKVKADRAKDGKAKVAGAAKKLKAMTDNPLVADVVAAALVATAAALKDSQKARQLAAQTGDELQAMAKDGAEKGNALWQLALEVGRRAIDELSSSETGSKRSRKK